MVYTTTLFCEVIVLLKSEEASLTWTSKTGFCMHILQLPFMQNTCTSIIVTVNLSNVSCTKGGRVNRQV